MRFAKGVCASARKGELMEERFSMQIQAEKARKAFPVPYLAGLVNGPRTSSLGLPPSISFFRRVWIKRYPLLHSLA